MFSLYKKLSTVLFFLLSGLVMFGQGEQWIGKLTLSSFDCENKQACYLVEIKGVSETPWALGDQNYRLFYDAENVSIQSVTSLLPGLHYSSVQVDEVLEIAGQGQEDYSPLDLIDDNLGFLDFSIIAYNKQNPSQASQIRTDMFLPVADICLDVSDELWETGAAAAMNLYFSEPTTAGQITNQQTVVTQIDGSNHTVPTNPIGFMNITYDSGLEGQLGELCAATNIEETLRGDTQISLYPNPINGTGMLSYNLASYVGKDITITLFDMEYKPVAVYKKSDEQGSGRVELEGLPAGVYVFQVHDGTNIVRKEFVVSN